ncbi:MAG: phosphate signaling complex protein PhoU [Alphaproteobacteria bacterium]|nr:phosphate signaling complex protein PhoU [Alphaproteobacteria bacterium]
MAPQHIVKSFDEELKKLNDIIMKMGGLAETQLQQAMEALIKRHSDLATKVIANDDSIDELEQEMSAMVIRILALRQPMAQDLREVITALKISSDLERIGDYATNVAKRSIALVQMPVVRSATTTIAHLSQLVQTIVKDVLDAYAYRNAEKAMQAWHRDEEVDALYTGIFRDLLTYMMEDPRNITPCTHLLFIAKNIERIGDHATNIAETIHFLVLGQAIEKNRPKADDTSFTIHQIQHEET